MTMTADTTRPLVDNPSKERALLRQYDLTPEEYAELLAAQNYRCAICLRTFGSNRSACVDHDHHNGGLRGLLCSRCNYDLLGRFGDDAALFDRAAAYLLQAPADSLREGQGVRIPDAPPMR